MWVRSAGPSATSRSRSPGPCASGESIAASTVAPSPSTRRGSPGKSGVSVPGSLTSATSAEHRHVDRGNSRQVARNLAPCLALVGAREQLPCARAEVDAGDVVRVDRHPLAQHAEMRILLRQALAHVLPAGTAVAGAP